MSGVDGATAFIYYIETWRGEGGGAHSKLALAVRLEDRDWISSGE